MRFFKIVSASLAILLLTLMGCGGGGSDGGTTPAPAPDTVAPTVSITAPANSAVVSGTMTISAVAADNVAVIKVDLYVNNALQATRTSAPYNFSWDTSSLSHGSYTLSAKAYDAAGNVGQSGSVTVTIPITVSMSTVISGSNAVGIVTLAGLPTPDAYGLNFIITMPATATASASPGAAANGASTFVSGQTVILAGTSIGSGQVMIIDFANLPAGTVAANFNISLSAVFDGSGVQIQ